ncbi:hypothetical protein N5923_15475 [Erwiniaceae bacterium BAC15a-03b]|uniref:Uncharacterized protein n=1 Tax=Winslowiella arboricola TaxID=2978220 RepID=A0A9J6PVP6_9GAMM|nr:hypothetical protein [Winslowiella arboricola]MCU5774345.1 hypothetical protein [Winslowiella arboricola]MCU5778892.1 hypothetical protein [Winslowiella arboricola]
MESRLWVFKELVGNDHDYQGILAYACYKLEKDKLARDLINAKKSEGDIAKSLKLFHAVSVTQGQLEKFREKGLAVMAALTESLDQGLIDKHKEEMDTLKNHYQNVLQQNEQACKKQLARCKAETKSITQKELLTKMRAWPLTHYSLKKKIFMWIWNGYQSVVAVFVLIFILHTVAYWSSDKEIKVGVLNSFWGRVQNMFNSPIPSSDVNLKTDADVLR